MRFRPSIVGENYPGFVFSQAPRNVYWEMTIACDLVCQHCRADAHPERDPSELTTEQAQALMRTVAGMGSMMVLTGGDPMKRDDLFQLIEYGREQGLSLAITPAMTPLLDAVAVRRFRELGVAAMGVSLDGPTAAVHDGFRGVPGTFESTLRALAWAREAGLGVQVNTTVTAGTIPHLAALYDVLRQRASPPVRRWSLFLLIPVGRGAELDVPSAAEVEQLLGWVYSVSASAPFHVSTVEAPHYRRYWIQRELEGGMTRAQIGQMGASMGFGIRDGNGVVFVSHLGEVYPAGFLPFPLLGDVRQRPLDEIYRESPFLKDLRNADLFEGRCGRCEFRWVCGGSRARAYAMLGNPLQEDPLCAFTPGNC